MKKQSVFSIFLIPLAFILLIIPLTTSRPNAFTVIRHISPSVTFQQFLSSISRPTYNASTNTQMGYNMISLAGFTQSSTLTKIDNNYSPLMVWRNINNIVLANKPNIYGSTNQQIQKYILDKVFHVNGSIILMHVQLIRSPVSTANPINIGQEIVNLVRQLQFDGISIHFQDYNAVKDGTASDWLQALLRFIKNEVPKLITVLILPPTFIPRIQILKSLQINYFCNYFILKYYNTGQPDYSSYQTLFQSSQFYPRTSIIELISRSDIKIDICRTLISKPTNQLSTWNNKQFINSSDLNNAFIQAYSKIGWFAGFANLYYQNDKNGVFVNAVLNGLMDQCGRYDDCVC